MQPPARFDLAAIAREFSFPGAFVDGGPYGSGHINDTFAIRCGSPEARFILQRINNRVFSDVPRLMDNVARVTAHLARVSPNPRSRLTLVPTRGGDPFFLDPDGGYWRSYRFIEDAHSFDRIENTDQAREGAFAFGNFQRLLSTLPPPRLHDTIPRFHDTRARFEALRKAVSDDRAGRLTLARAEVDMALGREPMVDTLLNLQKSGEIPERITHNDTKLNNVMLDAKTGKGLCVIDLDTTMPGLALYDFGDMVRTGTNSAVEDETDLSRVRMEMPLFKALVSGYLASAGSFLNVAEIGQLAFAGALITYEIGIRFLTDYLEGDVYFKVHRPSHNLDRCRCQFVLLGSIREQFDDMRRVVDSARSPG